MPCLPGLFRCSTEKHLSPEKERLTIDTITNHVSPMPTTPARAQRIPETVPMIGGGERVFGMRQSSQEQEQDRASAPPVPEVVSAGRRKEEERTEDKIKPNAPAVISIAIQGNIGCGKSTLLKGLRKAGYNVLPEPVSERWGIRLPTLYSDFVRWSFTFQMEVVEWYKQVQRNELTAEEWTPEPKILIMERSADIATQVFGKIHQEQGNMSEWEYSLLERFGDDVLKPTFEIYVRTPAEVCCERIRERNRHGEDDIPVDFIKTVEEKHEKLYMDGGEKAIQSNVVVVDGKQSKMDLTNQALEIIERFKGINGNDVISS